MIAHNVRYPVYFLSSFFVHFLYARDKFACLSVVTYSRENLSREKARFWGHANAAQAETFPHKSSLIWSTEPNVDHYLSVLQSHENCRMNVHFKITPKFSLKVNIP